ncbi:MAG: G8 domain-containing protein, partial [Gemmataceae bacterium]|nr:G8 domain-containing protein [Gemmataceae bacterium]
MRTRTLTLALLAAVAAAPLAPLPACPECDQIAKTGVAAGGTGTRWSDPATWTGGKPPRAGDTVVIPDGRAVVLDVSPPQLKGVLVKGQLRFDRQDLELKTGWVLVAGKGAKLEIGTAAEPFAQKATITLFGTDKKESVAGAGTKFLAAMGGGTLELHGARRDAVSWTQLGATAEPGAKELTLKDEVKWQPGDRICVAPSGYSPLEAEEVTVTAVVGKVVSVEPALKFKHWGTLQTFAGRALDERAEVGLLTRNVLVRGADDSTAAGFGGHVMVMAGGTARVEGVEFFRMGQRGHKARYPLHWHLVDREGDGTAPGKGQYARNNSVHHSFQRAVVVHGTNDVLVEGNVAFDVTNHCYVPAEDGDEERNVFRRNLGMLVRVPAVADYAFPGNKPESSTQQEAKASVFWMTNPNQVFEANHAAGSVGGDGFLFDGRTAA